VQSCHVFEVIGDNMKVPFAVSVEMWRGNLYWTIAVIILAILLISSIDVSVRGTSTPSTHAGSWDFQVVLRKVRQLLSAFIQNVAMTRHLQSCKDILLYDQQ